MSVTTLLLSMLAAPVAVCASLLGWQLATHVPFVAYHRRRGTGPAPLGLAGLARYHLREAWAALTLVSWYVRPHRPQPGLAGRPVLCVHGFTQNSTNFHRIRRALEQRGRPTAAVDLGPPGRDLRVYAAVLERELRAVVARAGDVDIAAHSMGGVVLRVTLASAPDLAARIRRVVTLGSPHAGTFIANVAPVLRDARQLRRRSRFLESLPGLVDLLPDAAVTAVAAERDLIVYPVSTALPAATRHVCLGGVGHVGLLTCGESVAAVVDAVCDVEAMAAAK